MIGVSFLYVLDYVVRLVSGTSPSCSCSCFEGLANERLQTLACSHPETLCVLHGPSPRLRAGLQTVGTHRKLQNNRPNIYPQSKTHINNIPNLYQRYTKHVQNIYHSTYIMNQNIGGLGRHGLEAPRRPKVWHEIQSVPAIRSSHTSSRPSDFWATSREMKCSDSG